jgi:hypothetical protein
MEILLVATMLLIVYLSWDSHQFIPIRVVSVEENPETIVCMIHMLKWPVVFKKKVYLVKDTGQFVIPNRKSVFEPIISSAEVEEAYIVWKYENVRN